MFTPIQPVSQPHTHKLAIVAKATAETYRVPGKAKTLHIVALSHNGKRFQVSKGAYHGIYAYGDGVTVKIAERAGQQYYITAVSISGTQNVHVTYTMQKKAS